MDKSDYPVSVNIEKALNKLLKGSVPLISTDILAESLVAPSNWVVLDSRESAEFNISHLPDAKWVGHKNFSESKVANIAKDTNVVVYCSIGVRSEVIAEKLISFGFTHVWNLYGGIFSWANQGRLLVDQNQQNTNVVHGYNKSWSKLVNNPFCEN